MISRLETRSRNIGVVIERSQSAKRRRRASGKGVGKCLIESLEVRILLSGYSTVNIDSSTPVTIPVENTKAGQTVPLNLDFSTSDETTPEDTENEWVEIKGSDGYQMTVQGYGTQTIEFPITQNGETISAWIDNAEQDEAGTITVGDRTIEVNVDLAALTAPWRTFADDLNKSEQAIERILENAPGWEFYAPNFQIETEGQIVGKVKIGPDGSIDGGSLGLKGGVSVTSTAEAYWGLPAKLAGVSLSLTAGLGLSLSGEASYENGEFQFGGDAKGEGSLTLAGNSYLTFFKGFVYGKGAIELPLEKIENGVASGSIELTGEVGGALQYKGLTDEDYTTLAKISTSFGPVNLGEWEINYQSILNDAIQVAEDVGGGDPLLVTSQPPSTVAAGTPFGMVVTATNADGSVNQAFNGPVTVTDAGSGGLTGTTTVLAINGVATFTGLSFKNATTNDQLYVSSSNGTVYTSAIHVTPGNASSVTVHSVTGDVSTNPVSQFQIAGMIGVLLPNWESGVPILPLNAQFGVTVNAEASDGTLLTNYNGPVTIALGYNPTGATLVGKLTVNAVNGVATFDNLSVDKLGSGFFLTTTGTNAQPGVSSTFNVSDYLAITTKAPDQIVAGVPFNLVVEAQGGSGSVDTSFNGNVTISNSNYNGGSTNLIHGTTTVKAVNGIATFTGLTLDQEGNYSLIVSGANLAFTSQYVFGTSGTATHLEASIPPPSALSVGTPFSVTIAALDAFGNLDRTRTGNVTLTLGDNTAGATLGGTLSGVLSSGLLTFSNLTINKAGSYTIKAKTAGLPGLTTIPFNVNASGAATQLQISGGFASNAVAGTGFGFTVKAEDDAGAIDPSFNGIVTLTLNPNTTGGRLGGTLTARAVLGVATFTNLKIDTTGSYTILVSSAGLNSTTSPSLTVSPAAPSKIVVSTPTGVYLPGSTLGETVTIEDAYGNVADVSQDVTLALGANPSRATLGGTLKVTTTAGVANFSNLTIDKPGGGYTLTAKSGTLTTGTSSAFNIENDKLVVVSPPLPGTAAGSSFGLVVKAVNASGVVDTTFNGNLTLSLIQFNRNNAALSGTLSVPAKNGFATFTGLSLNLVGNYVLTVSAAGATPVATPPFRIGASQISVSAEPPRLVNASTPFSIIVTASDASGIVDPTYNGPVTLTLSGGAANGALRGTITVNAVNGVASFSGLTIDKPGAGYRLTATASGLGSSVSTGFGVIASGSATRLVVTSLPPGSVPAGTSFGLVVKAVDGSGAVDTSFHGAVTLNDSARSLFGTLNVNAVNGVATFTGLSISSAWPIDQLTASSAGLASASAGQITVTSSPASHLAVILPQGPITTNSPFVLHVEALDNHGDIDPSYNGVVTVALGSSAGGTLQGLIQITAVNGVATFSGLSIPTAAQGVSITATGNGGLSGVGSPFDVTSDRLVFTVQPSGGLTVGSTFNVRVAAENGAGIIDTGFNGVITLSAASFGQPLGGTTTARAVNGVAIFSGLSLGRVPAMASTLAAVAPGLPTGVSAPFSVLAGAPTHLVVVAEPPSSVTALAPFQLVVAVEDAFGNVVTTYNGDLTLALSSPNTGGKLGGTLTVSASGGISSFNALTLSSVGQGYTFVANASGLAKAVTTSVTVSPAGVATRLVVTAQPPGSVTAGETFGLVVEAEDGFGHLVSSYNGKIVLTSPSGSPLSGTTTSTAAGGIATFSGLALTRAGLGDILQATGSGLATGATQPFDVNAGAAVQLVAQSLGGNLLVGSSFNAVVLAKDAYGNVDPNYQLPITLQLASYTAGSALGGVVTVTPSGGAAYFSGLSINKPGTDDTLVPRGGTLKPVASTPFNVAGDQIAIWAQPPSVVTAGVGFGFTVSAEDALGRVDTSYNGPVTVSLYNPVTGGLALGGALTARAVNGVATFTGITTTQAGQFRLIVSANAVAGTTTGTINALASTSNPAPVLSVASHSLTVTAGLVQPPIVVTILGPNGSPLTTDNSTVTLVITSGPAGGLLSGTFVTRAINGVATFNNLALPTPGNYIITATDGRDTPVSFSVVVQANTSGPIVVHPNLIPSGYGTGRDAFVNRLYTELLGRQAGTLELRHWARILAHRGNPKSVALAFWESREHRLLVKQHVVAPLSFAHAYKDAWLAALRAVHPLSGKEIAVPITKSVSYPVPSVFGKKRTLSMSHSTTI